MKLKDITVLLTNILGKPINQSMLATSLGITRQTISNRIKNDSELTVSELTKIEKYFSVNITNQVKGLASNDILIDYYPDVFASCGEGVIVYSDTKDVIAISRKLLSMHSRNKKYSMIHARGNSMIPTINDSDKLIIEHCENEQIIDNKIYVFCYKQEFYVKRLSKNLDEIIIKSDNPEYSTRVIKDVDLQDLKIIGRVIEMIKKV